MNSAKFGEITPRGHVHGVFGAHFHSHFVTLRSRLLCKFLRFNLFSSRDMSRIVRDMNPIQISANSAITVTRVTITLLSDCITDILVTHSINNI